MYNLVTKTLYDKRAFIVGWCLGLAAVGFLMTIFYPAFHQDSGIDELVKNLPAAFQGLVGDLANLKQLPSYIGSQLFEIRIPIFLSILGIILAVGVTVGEEEKGQLRTLTALPLSRTRIALQKWCALVIICLLVTAATFVGLEMGLLVIHETLDGQVMVRLGLMTWLLAVTMATVVFGVGLGSGRRGLTMALGVLVTAGSFILTTFTQSVDWLQPYEKLSLLHYYPAADIAQRSIQLSDVVVLVVVFVVFLVIGVLGFRYRDIE